MAPTRLQLEIAKEENRQLYLGATRRMLDLQERIDELTRDNVRLIRSLAPQQAFQW